MPLIVLNGNASGGMKFFRRTSAGSMPISSASRSTIRSIRYAASGPGTSVGVDRRRIRVRAAHFVVESGDPVGTGNDEHVENGRDGRRERLQIRTDVRDGPYA